MAGYLGHKPTISNYTVDEFTTSSAQASSGNFTLSQTVTNSKTLEVSVGGIDQPQSAYSVTGTTLAFGASVVTLGDIVIARHAGESISYPSLEASAVTTAKINADAVDGTKIADNAIDSEHYTDASIDLAHMSVNSIDSDQYVDASIDEAHIANDAVNFVTHLKAGTDGELITWDASGDPAAVAVGTSGQVLTSGGTGVAPTFAAAAAGGVSDMSIWRLPSDQAFSAGANTVLTGWGEMTESSSYGYKRIGSAITYSSGIFAFPSTGTWLVDCKLMISFPASTAALYTQGNFEFTNNNSSYTVIGAMKGVPGGTTGYWHGLEQSCSNLISVDDIANDKVRVRHYNSHAGTFQGSNSIHSYMRFYKFSTATT